jgi:hypothetical protein
MNRFRLSRLLPALALLCLLVPPAKAQDVYPARPAQTVRQNQPEAQSSRCAAAPCGFAASATSAATLAVPHPTGCNGVQAMTSFRGPSSGREFLVGALSTLGSVVGGAIGALFGEGALCAAFGAGVGGTVAAWIYDHLSLSTR